MGSSGFYVIGRVGYVELDKSGRSWFVSVGKEGSIRDPTSESGYKNITVWHPCYVRNSKLFPYVETIKTGEEVLVVGEFSNYPVEVILQDGRTHSYKKWVVNVHSIYKLREKKKTAEVNSNASAKKTVEGDENFDYNTMDSQNFNLGGDGNEMPY